MIIVDTLLSDVQMYRKGSTPCEDVEPSVRLQLTSLSGILAAHVKKVCCSWYQSDKPDSGITSDITSDAVVHIYMRITMDRSV